jgi:uncharacterized membrane protein YhaH (DUF805 family)
MSKRIKKKKNAFVLSGQSPFVNYWKKENYWILLTGLALVVIGFFLMAQSPYDNPVSLTVSPIILLIAYVVVFPLAILYKGKKQEVESEKK